jgi:hypothetical protein
VIVTEHITRRGELLYRWRLTRLTVALVLTRTRGADSVVLWPGRPGDRRQLRGLRPRALYEVDLGEHDGRIEDQVPAQGDTFAFHAVVDLRWHIHEPATAVWANLRTTDDVVRAVRPELLHHLRTTTRRFDVTASEAAERSVNERLTAAPVGAGLGITCTAWTRLSVDPGTQRHAAALRDVTHQVGLEKATHELRILADSHNRDLVNARIEHYLELLKAGDHSQVALRLAHNPEDLATVIDAAKQEALARDGKALDFLSELVSSGMVERHELDDRIGMAIDWARTTTNSITGSTRWVPDGPGRTTAHMTSTTRIQRPIDLPPNPPPSTARAALPDPPASTIDDLDF